MLLCLSGNVSRPPRLGAAEYRGHQLYFLTICCYRRRNVFVRPEVVDLVLQQILRAGRQRHFAINAYCFMPNHFHALAGGVREDSDLPQFASLAKQNSGFHFKRIHRHRLWQEGYFDRVLRSDETEMAVIRYIVENPIRAGIVRSPEEYPYWGSQVYTREEILEAIACRRRP
jgi:REP element-mobilizing transposase RayT